MGFDDVSLQKYGQSSYEYCYVHQWGVLWGVFRNVPNSRAVVTLFDSDWLLLILMMFHYKSMVTSLGQKKKIWIWASLFTGQFCIGIRTPQKKFQIYRPINDSLLAISILGVFTM